MANIMGRDADQVIVALNNGDLCVSDHAEIPKTAPVAIRVNVQGFVVSTNPVWNACTQHSGQVSQGLIESNRDTSISRQGSIVTYIPLTCSDYHKNNQNVWKHPDFPGLEVTLDAKGRLIGSLPAAYVAVHDKMTTAINKSGAVVSK